MDGEPTGARTVERHGLGATKAAHLDIVNSAQGINSKTQVQVNESSSNTAMGTPMGRSYSRPHSLAERKPVKRVIRTSVAENTA